MPKKTSHAARKIDQYSPLFLPLNQNWNGALDTPIIGPQLRSSPRTSSFSLAPKKSWMVSGFTEEKVNQVAD